MLNVLYSVAIDMDRNAICVDNFRLLPICIALVFLMFNVSLLSRSQSHTVCRSTFSCSSRSIGLPEKQYNRVSSAYRDT